MKVFIENNLKTNIFVQNFINNYPNIENITYYSDFDNIMNKININFTQNNYKNIVFRYNKSNFIKNCPCTKNVVCCNYYVMNIIQNCNLECTYCYLQQYVNNNTIIINANLENIENEIKILSESSSGQIRLGSGEFSDSLLFDNYTGITKFLIKKIINFKNIIFEIKTKTNNIYHLLDIPDKYKKNIVFAWSLNPQKIINIEEKKAVNLIERLNAAKKMIDNGYSIGFHFDPIIVTKNFEKLYSDLIKTIYDYIPLEKILWYSIGSFRCNSSLINIIRHKYPESNTYKGEFISGLDKKSRYPKYLRIKTYKYIINELNKYKSNITKLYLCMEPLDVYKEINLDYSFLKNKCWYAN